MAEQETDARYPEELPGEDWRPLDPPYEDWLISNHGRVWAMRTRRIIMSRLDQRGDRTKPREGFKLPTLRAMEGGRYGQTARTLSREVMAAFGPPPPAPTGYVAACIDGDERNCHISNLEWRKVDSSKRWPK